LGGILGALRLKGAVSEGLGGGQETLPDRKIRPTVPTENQTGIRTVERSLQKAAKGEATQGGARAASASSGSGQRVYARHVGRTMGRGAPFDNRKKGKNVMTTSGSTGREVCKFRGCLSFASVSQAGRNCAAYLLRAFCGQ
jgi:hypothetical protein